MFRLIAVLSLATIIAGCNTTRNPAIIVEKPIVFIPDSEFFFCPTVTQLPNVATLTDAEVAELIVNLDTNNLACKDSINTIRNELRKAKAALEKDNG